MQLAIENFDPQNSLFISSLKSLYIKHEISGELITPDSVVILKNLAVANIYLSIPVNISEGEYQIVFPDQKFAIEVLSGIMNVTMLQYRMFKEEPDFFLTLPGTKINYFIQGNFADQKACNYPTISNVFLVNRRSGINYPVANIVNRANSFSAEITFPLDTGTYYLSIGDKAICPARTEILTYLPMLSLRNEFEVGDTVSFQGSIQPTLNALNIAKEDLSKSTSGYFINDKNVKIPLNKFEYRLQNLFKAEAFLPITMDSGSYRLVLQSKYFKSDLVSNGIEVKYRKLESQKNLVLEVPALKTGVYRDSIVLGASYLRDRFHNPLCMTATSVSLVHSTNGQIIPIVGFTTNKKYYYGNTVYAHFTVKGSTAPGNYIPQISDKNCHILFDTAIKYLQLLPPTINMNTGYYLYRGHLGQKGAKIQISNLNKLLGGDCLKLTDIKIKHSLTNSVISPSNIIQINENLHDMTLDIPLSADTGKYLLYTNYDTLKCNKFKDETLIFIVPPDFYGFQECPKVDFAKPSICASLYDTVNISFYKDKLTNPAYTPKPEYFRLKNSTTNKTIPAFQVDTIPYYSKIKFLIHDAEPGKYELQVNYPEKVTYSKPLIVEVAPLRIYLREQYGFADEYPFYSPTGQKDTLHVYAAGFNFKDPKNCFFFDSLKIYLFDSTTNKKIFPDKLIYKNYREFDFIFTSKNEHDNNTFQLIFEGSQCLVKCKRQVVIKTKKNHYVRAYLEKGEPRSLYLTLYGHNFADSTRCHFPKIGIASIVDSSGKKFAALNSFNVTRNYYSPNEMIFNVKIPDNLDLTKKYFFNYETPVGCAVASFKEPITINPMVLISDTFAFKPYLAVKVYGDTSMLTPRSCFYPTKENTSLVTQDSLNNTLTYQADSIRIFANAKDRYSNHFTAYFTVPTDDPEFHYKDAWIRKYPNQLHTIKSGAKECRFTSPVWVVSRSISTTQKSLNPSLKNFVSVVGRHKYRFYEQKFLYAYYE